MNIFGCNLWFDVDTAINSVSNDSPTSSCRWIRFEMLISFMFAMQPSLTELNKITIIHFWLTDGECLSPENTSPYVSGNASPDESHHHHPSQCYELPPMTAMNMTIQQQQQQQQSDANHYSNTSPASYSGSVSPNVSQSGMNNNEFSTFSAYYAAATNAAAGGSSNQQHYYSNSVIQQHSPEHEDQHQPLMSS